MGNEYSYVYLEYSYVYVEYLYVYVEYLNLRIQLFYCGYRILKFAYS